MNPHQEPSIEFATVPRTRMSLTTLPLELILCVFKCSDWQDILSLRQTCLLLNQASKERAVFHNLVTRYASIIPKTSFHLERPLFLYNSQGLENIIHRWKAAERGWTTDPANVAPSCSNSNPPSPTTLQLQPHLNPTRLIHLDRPLKAFHLIDGGRWLLVVKYSGAVCYYDLHHPTPTSTSNKSESEIGPPRSLIPDLTERRPWTVVLTAVDMDYKEPFLAFNFAIYTRIWLGFSSEQIQIWRVTLELDDHKSGIGLKATRLTTISPLGLNSSPMSISLCEHQVAWHCGNGDAISVVVVDWTTPGAHDHARSEARTPLRMLKMKKIVHLGRAPEISSFQLIRGKLLLAAKPWLILYDLATAPTFHLGGNSTHPPAPVPPGQAQANPNSSVNPAPLATPHIWRNKLSNLLTRSLSKPFFCPLTNTIRFVIFTRLVVYGLVIPMVDTLLVPDGVTKANQDAETRIVKLGAYDMENEPCGFTSGYHTAVLHSFKPERVILRYRWPEEIEPCAIATFGPAPAFAMNDPDALQTQAASIMMRTGELGMLVKQRTVAITCKYFDPFTPAMDEGSGRVVLSAQSGKQLAVVDFAMFQREEIL